MKLYITSNGDLTVSMLIRAESKKEALELAISALQDDDGDDDEGLTIEGIEEVKIKGKSEVVDFF
tara:strand:+ start:338 stop:532 length:195 start_codon:yes stop_codon:yes gene_type:complete